MKTNLLSGLGLLLLLTVTSCQGPAWVRRSGQNDSGAGTRTVPEGMMLEERLAMDGYQSRVVSLDSGTAGPTGRIVYQELGTGDMNVFYLYPSATKNQMVLVLRNVAKTPLLLAQMWRTGSPPHPSEVAQKEIDPAPRNHPYVAWNPALENLKPGTTVLAVWPTASGTPSFDPSNTNFRSRLLLVLTAKP